MLKLRVITGLILAAAGLAALFGLPGPAFATVTGIVFLGLGGREFARLARLAPGAPRLGYAAAVMTTGALAWSLLVPAAPYWLWALLCLLWLWPALWMAGFRGVAEAAPYHPPARLAVGITTLVPGWLALAWLQTHQPWWVFLLLVVVSAADVGAYFSGRAIGGRKLAPRISPGKTWAGAFGALLCAPVLTALAAGLIPDTPLPPAAAAGVALVLVPVSIMGDLFISMLKRLVGLKDSGTLLPGHGGVLDRFDSLVAVLPFYALAVSWSI